MSLCLTDKEVSDLTGKQRSDAQIKALRTLGVRHMVRTDGSPVVIRGNQSHEDVATPEGMLSRHEIVNRAKAIKKIAGVYFLVSGSDVIYVGQSLHVVERIGSHLRRCDISFDSYYYIVVPKSRLIEVERAYIKLLEPRKNVLGRAAR